MIKKSELIKDTYKPGELAKMLGCSKSTLTNRERAGKLRTYYVDSGRRYYKKEDVILALKEKDLLIEDDIRSDVLYARVSTHNQKNRGDLDRQISYSLSKIALMNPNDLEIFSDVGSGLNDERKNFKEVLNKIMSGEVDRLFVLYKDRLARFGFGQIEEVCKHFGTEIVVLSEDEKSQSLEEELAEDIVSIIHSFSGKLYGMRRKKVKNEIDEVLKDG